jgi:multiple antibiotic resistance protein
LRCWTRSGPSGVRGGDGGGQRDGRRRLALYIALFAVVFLSFFYLTGMALLDFFGISMPAFRIAGGILLFLLGLDMARENFAESFADETERRTTRRTGAAMRGGGSSGLIVPFAMPLLIGPGRSPPSSSTPAKRSRTGRWVTPGASG